MQENFNHAGQFLFGFLTAFLGFVYGRVKAWKKHHGKSELPSRNDLHKALQIENVLTELRSALGADRAMICQFKNGEHYSSGESVQKLVMTHCVCRIGISFPVVNHQSEAIQVSFISSLLVELMDRKQCDFVVRDSPDSFYLKSFWILNGTTFSKMHGLFSPQGKMIGVLILNYVTSNYIPFKDEDLASSASLIAANLMS